MPHTNENLKNESGFRFQDLPSNLIEEFHRLKARLTEGKAIYFNPNLKLLVISNNPKSPHLSSYKQVKYNYQDSSLCYAEGTKNINLQRQKCELIKSITGENPGPEFFKFLNSFGLRFSQMTELEVLNNFKLFLIENGSEDADQISKITQKIEEISKS